MGIADSSRRKRRPSSLRPTGSANDRAADRSDGPIAHVPVLLPAVLEAMQIAECASYIDATVGLGGHAEAILSASTQGRLLGIDADPAAVARSRERLAKYGARAVIVQGNFRELEDVAQANGFASTDGILFDLGISSLQLSAEGRGFSFQHAAPLDMRMDPGLPRTASDLVNELPEADIVDLLYRYGEEPHSRGIARAIVRQRPIDSTDALARIVCGAVGGQHSRIHPATRTFQALRIAVNDELRNLPVALSAAVGLLRSGGRLAVISFHSLEDRIVKQFFQHESRDCVCPPVLPACVCSHRASLRLPRRSAVQPEQSELALNPRARSAKLRIAERV